MNKQLLGVMFEINDIDNFKKHNKYIHTNHVQLLSKTNKA